MKINNMYSQKRQIVGGAIALALALAITWAVVKKQSSHRDYTAPPREEERSSQRRLKASIITESTESAVLDGVLDSSADSTPQATIQEAELDRIQDNLDKVATSYDAENLSKIDPYLSHTSPEVRKAAIDAMITLGDASAGPLLRIAAAKASSPHEAVALQDAADYVELPPAKLEFKKKKK